MFLRVSEREGDSDQEFWNDLRMISVPQFSNFVVVFVSWGVGLCN